MKARTLMTERMESGFTLLKAFATSDWSLPSMEEADRESVDETDWAG